MVKSGGGWHRTQSAFPSKSRRPSSGRPGASARQGERRRRRAVGAAVGVGQVWSRVALKRVSWRTSDSVRVGFMYRLRSPTIRGGLGQAERARRGEVGRGLARAAHRGAPVDAQGVRLLEEDALVVPLEMAAVAAHPAPAHVREVEHLPQAPLPRDRGWARAQSAGRAAAARVRTSSTTATVAVNRSSA